MPAPFPIEEGMPEDVGVLGILLFCAAVVASLAASWLLVSRLERLGERAGFSEAWLGLVAALAADARRSLRR
jgi:Ca2+/Na+ antiporter